MEGMLQPPSLGLQVAHSPARHRIPVWQLTPLGSVVFGQLVVFVVPFSVALSCTWQPPVVELVDGGGESQLPTRLSCCTAEVLSRPPAIASWLVFPLTKKWPPPI